MSGRVAVVLGLALMLGGVVLILSVPDLSGGTLLGALVFLLGLYLVQRVTSARELLDDTEGEEL